jgi:hypothetical protein
MMEAVSTFETCVIFVDTIRCNIPKVNNLHTYRCENLESHKIKVY